MTWLKNRSWIPEVVIVAVVLLMKTNLTFVGPDDFMRAAWLADNLEAGHVVPLSLYFRDGGPGGVIIHWGLAWNLILIGLGWIPAQFVGWRSAFSILGPIVGTGLIVVEMLTAAWVVRRLDDKSIRFDARAAVLCLVTIIGPPIGSIHHHQAVAATVFLAAAFGAEGVWSRRTSFLVLCGVLLPFACDVSADAVPACLVIIGLLVVALIVLDSRLREIAIFVGATVVSSAIMLLLDPPYLGRFVEEPFHYSILHGALLSIAAVSAGLGAAAADRLCPRLKSWGVVLFVGLSMALGGAIWVGAFWHALFASDFYHMPMEILSRIVEHRGIDTFDRAIRVLIGTAFAVPGPLLLGCTARDPARRMLWLSAVAAVVAMTIPAAMHVRFCPYQQMCAAPFIAVTAWQSRRVWKLWRPARLSKAVVLNMLFVGVAAAAVGYVLFGPDQNEAESVSMDCRVGPIAGELGRSFAPETLLFADIFISPEVLFRTNLRTLSAPYQGHPNDTLRTYLDVVNSRDIGAGGAARSRLRELGVSALLLCPRSYKASGYVIPGGLGDKLAREVMIPWLVEQPWVHGGQTGLKLFLVR